MSDRLSRVESRLAGIDEALADLSERIRRLEGAASPIAAGPVDPEPTPIDARLAAAPLDAMAGLAGRPAVLPIALSGAVSFTGRTLMVLGGAYVLRALAESGRIPISSGVALGVAYALLWMILADRAGTAGHAMSGVFHGIAALLIGLPLVWEASTKFALLTLPMGAIGLAVIASLALAAAWHRSLAVLAGSAIGAAIIAATALALAAAQPLLAAWLLLYVTAASWGLADARDWPWLRWPAALAGDLVIAIVVLRRGVLRPLGAIDQAPILVWVLVVLTLMVVAWRTLGRRRAADGFDVTQLTIAALLTSAILLPGAGEWRPQLFPATTALVIGMMAYAAALRLIGRQAGDRRSAFLLWTIAGFVFIAAATVSLFPPLVVTCIFAALAIALPVQRAAYGLAAALAAGIVGLTATAFFSSTPFAPATASSLVSIAVVVAAALAGIWRSADDSGVWARISRLTLAALAAVLVADTVVLLAVSSLAGAEADASTLATLRTSAIALLAVIAALAGRSRRLEGVARLHTALLAVGGLKLIAEDLRVTRPFAMVIVFAVYGAALIAAPRLARRGPAEKTLRSA